MGALKIDCYCNERQMRGLVKLVADYLNMVDRSALTDIDEEVDGVRLCVEFEIYMDEICLKNSEVLDDDWEVLYEDTAVLTSRLKAVVKAYNRNYEEARRMYEGLRSEHLEEIGIDIEI